MGLKYKLLTETAKRPTKGTERSAGWDLYADCEPCEIKPRETVKIGVGFACAIPNGYFGGIYSRSSVAAKKGLRIASGTGVIDSDYRGEIIVPLHNDSNKIQTVYRGDRIAQMIIQPYYTGDLEPVETLDETERGAGGFGSTGE